MEGAKLVAVAAALAHIAKVKHKVEANEKDGGELTVVLDHVEMNDPESFDVVDWDTKDSHGRPVVLSGALWLGRTRLIDNIILGDVQGKIISQRCMSQTVDRCTVPLVVNRGD